MSLHSKLYDEKRCKKVENPVEKYVSNGKRDISFELMVNYKNASLDEWTDSEDESSKKKKKGQLYIHHFNVINQIDEQFCIIKLPTKILRRSAISPHNYTLKWYLLLGHSLVINNHEKFRLDPRNEKVISFNFHSSDFEENIFTASYMG